MDEHNGTPEIDRRRRAFLRHAVRVTSGLALAPLLEREAAAQDNLFSNPPEIVHKNGVLKGVIQLSDADRYVPNAGSTHLRMFQGWDLSQSSSNAAPAASNVAPGPTLRAKVGGRVDIMFLNRIDDGNFSYTLDAASNSEDACDANGVIPGKTGTYPFVDQWPDCFHGSSTSNLHFHGTHTNPDGLGDNVLVQVIPNKNTSQSDWEKVFSEIFNAPRPPASWSRMPQVYQVKQLGYTAQQLIQAHHAGKKLPPRGLVAEYDKEQLAKAQRDNRKPSGSLWEWDVAQVVSGQWPQYVVGAYPNSLMLPDYAKGGFQAGQTPGTHWYHAHKHGSTSLHIFNGLAGVLIVEGDYDQKIHSFFQKQLPAGHPFTERVMVFQQIVATQNLLKPNLGDNPRSGNNQKLINGKSNPTIAMMPGEIQLWRIVNAMGGGGKGTIDASLFANMEKEGFEIRQVACDGVQFAWENYLAQPFLSNDVPGGLTISAGNRADLLVKAPATPKTSPFPVAGDLNNSAATQIILFTVAVANPPGQPPLPKPMEFFTAKDEKEYPAFPHYLHNLPPPGPALAGESPRQLVFGWDRGPGPGPNPPRFTINGKQFLENQTKVDQCMRLNSVEDWVLSNTSGPPAVHPFHIHINPFQVLEIATVDSKGALKIYKPSKGPPVWQDVVGIPVGGWVRIRHKFADFTGTYVLHCHILAHEDRGMMQLVRVIPDGADPARACAIDHIAHH